MKIILWLAIFISVLFLEVSFLPSFFGSAVPSLTTAVLIVGIALADFRTGFWFGGLAGIMRDILAPSTLAGHTILFLGLFFAMRFFLILTQWEEPLRRIGAVFFGLLVWPLVWILSAWVGRWFFGTSLPFLEWRDLASWPAALEITFAVVWFSVFSWLAIKSAARRRILRLTRL